MNDARVQIFPISEIKRRAAVSPNDTNIVLYVGHNLGGRPGIATYNIRRDLNTKEWDQMALDYIDTLTGDYTVQFKPSKNVFFVSASVEDQPNDFAGLNGVAGFNFMQQRPQQSQSELINQILELNRELDYYKKICKEQEEELERLDSGADKFAYALEKMAMNLLPQFGLMPTNQTARPMQGAPQNNTNMAEWQNKVIDHNDPTEMVGNALEVLVMALGEQKIVDIAKRLQREPHLVNTINSFL